MRMPVALLLDSMGKLVQMDVLIVGLTGLGVETGELSHTGSRVEHLAILVFFFVLRKGVRALGPWHGWWVPPSLPVGARKPGT